MLKMRLARFGMKGRPSYRIVVISQQRKGHGKPVDLIGYWYPSKETKKIDHKKVNYWLGLGVQPSSGLRKLISK